MSTHRISHEQLPLKVTLKAFAKLIKMYWTSKDSKKSWLYLLSIIIFTGGSVYLATAINTWYKTFWDTLQNYDLDGFKHQLLVFVMLATIHVLVTVYNKFIQSKLSIEWRRWLTENIMSTYLKDSTYYKIQLTDTYTDNPDQRIAEDLYIFVGDTIGLLLGLASDIAMLITFSIVLWGLSQATDLTLPNGYVLHLPDGYLFYLALLYSIIGTVVTFLLGKPLVKINFRQQKYEANFRYSLIRLRESSESISLYKGESREKEILNAKFKDVVSNYVVLINLIKKLGFLTLGYAQTAVIFPILIAAPLYFAKLITIGTIMQINSAFARVQDSLSTLVSNFTSWASYKAVIDRLSFFLNAIENSKNLKCIEAKVVEDTVFNVQNLKVFLNFENDSRVLVDNLSFSLKSGDRLLIKGQSGCGKSTMLRALSGIWPFAEGEIETVSHDKTLFLSQKPYLPLGSLRECAFYPLAIDKNIELDSYFKLFHLEHLIEKLDNVDQWSHILSLGEMQRIAFIRALLNKPKVIFLDEATSALDENLEQLCYQKLIETLGDSIIVSVGHRPSLVAMHNKFLTKKDNSFTFS